MSYIYNMVDTWNAGGTTFTAVKMNVTDTASAAGSLLIDLQVGGVSKFSVTKGGVITVEDQPIRIISNTTLNVPAEFSSIQSALNYLANKTISANAVVTIAVADGTYQVSSTINIEHPDGAQIRIIGNQSTPTNCVLQVSTEIPLFYVGDGCAVDLIDGFDMQHTDPASRANSTSVLADRGASVKLGPNMLADGFYWGYFARRGSYLEARGCTATNSGDCGFHALDGATIDATDSVSTDADDSANLLGCGYVAERAWIIANGATASGNWLDGFQAIENGGIKSTNASASNSVTGSGFKARDGGVIYANGSTSDGNARYGYEFDGISEINGTITNPGTANTLGLYKDYLEEFFSSQPGFIVRSPSANAGFRVDTKGTGSFFVNVNSALQFSVSDGAVAAGTDNDVDVGTSSVYFKNAYLYRYLGKDGSAASPTFTFGADSDTGFYRATTDTTGITRNGSFVGEFGATLRYDGGFSIGASTVVNSDRLVLMRVYTVATLPANIQGARAFVSDANATTFASIVAGGGANGVPVYNDGTNWRIG